jgi:hypothetical protein
MDQHVPHAHQQCSPSIGPCSCQKRIFPSWHIACVVAECSKPIEYVTCAPLMSSEDEDVIQIYHHKEVGEGSQYIIHQPHESGWCIC